MPLLRSLCLSLQLNEVSRTKEWKDDGNNRNYKRQKRWNKCLIYIYTGTERNNKLF